MRRPPVVAVAALALAFPSCASLPPQPDSDGDGIPDLVDRCPTRYGPIATLGCPEDDKAPGEVCPLAGQTGDPSTWCGCWEKSARTDGAWHYTGDCKPKTCAGVTCPAEKPECAETPDGPTCYKPRPTCPTCQPGSECKDPAAGCLPIEKVDPPVIPDWEMTGTVPGPATRWDAVWGGVLEWAAANPSKVRNDCTNGGMGLARGSRDAMASNPWGAAIHEAYVGIAAIMWRGGILAGHPVTRDGGHTDKFAAQQAEHPERFEYYHLLEEGGACFGDARCFNGIFVRGGPVPACPPPDPPMDAGHLKLTVKEHNWCEFPTNPSGCIDATLIATQSCEFCESVGLGWYGEPGNSLRRCSCSMRKEGPEDYDARLCWEAHVLRGDYQWRSCLQLDSEGRCSIAGPPPDVNPLNHAQARCPGEGPCHLQVCAADGSFCSEWITR